MKVFFQINQLPFAFSVGSHMFACSNVFQQLDSPFANSPRLPSPKYALLSSQSCTPA